MFGRSFEPKATAIGVESEDGRILGVTVFHNWQPEYGTIQASTAAVDARWLLCRAAISAVFDYAFKVCGCHKIWACTAVKNTRALRMLKVWGMQPEAVLQHHFGADDVVISRKFSWEHYGVEARPAQAA